MRQLTNKLPAAVVVCASLAACELVGVGVMAVSGPECGESGLPPDLDANSVNILDWDRIDESIAVFREYEDAHIPDIMATLAFLYTRNSETLSNDPAYRARAVRLFTWAALCGYAPAVFYVGEYYSEGLIGLPKDPALGSCLTKVYDRHRHERALIPGRVWACGLRLEAVEG